MKQDALERAITGLGELTSSLSQIHSGMSSLILAVEMDSDRIPLDDLLRLAEQLSKVTVQLGDFHAATETALRSVGAVMREQKRAMQSSIDRAAEKLAATASGPVN